jgi:hypothetical protein
MAQQFFAIFSDTESAAQIVGIAAVGYTIVKGAIKDAVSGVLSLVQKENSNDSAGDSESAPDGGKQSAIMHFHPDCGYSSRMSLHRSVGTQTAGCPLTRFVGAQMVVHSVDPWELEHGVIC